MTTGALTIQVPCLCGHAMHYGRACAEPGCRCTTSSPDYVAYAEANGQTVTPEHRAYTESMKVAFGWRPVDAHVKTCAYCCGKFHTLRRHTKTCSGACKVAMHRALQYPTDTDVPTSPMRSDSFAADRAAATGSGLMTADEQFTADMRVRRKARKKR